jgi:DNA-binding XRE family transcriptional regulator/quercetin dioxygenase-like cupin family protein
MDDGISERLAENLRALRSARNLTQAQAATAAGIPRATWAHLEGGGGNPTLAVLLRASAALRVPVEELLATPPSQARLWRGSELPSRRQGGGVVRTLLPEPVPGVQMDRIELAAGAVFRGTPHLPGTREWLACERGRIELRAAGSAWELEPGDVLAFRGDQRHAYRNAGDGVAVGWSVVLLAG